MDSFINKTVTVAALNSKSSFDVDFPRRTRSLNHCFLQVVLWLRLYLLCRMKETWKLIRNFITH